MDLRGQAHATAHGLRDPTGLKCHSEGWEGQIRPRSGWHSPRTGHTECAGTIDADYRGELKVLLINLGPEPIEITRGMRIAQMLITPAPQCDIVVVEDLDDTERGESGFGSTGTQ